MDCLPIVFSVGDMEGIKPIDKDDASIFYRSSSVCSASSAGVENLDRVVKNIIRMVDVYWIVFCTENVEGNKRVDKDILNTFACVRYDSISCDFVIYLL